MTDTFTYTPSKGVSKSSKARVITSQFGDGYSQRAPDGLNPVSYEWNLTFKSNPISKANLILQFFEQKMASTAFWWTPPGESTQYLVICPEWTKTYDNHLSVTISAKFVQVFDAV